MREKWGKKGKEKGREVIPMRPLNWASKESRRLAANANANVRSKHAGWAIARVSRSCQLCNDSGRNDNLRARVAATVGEQLGCCCCEGVAAIHALAFCDHYSIIIYIGIYVYIYYAWPPHSTYISSTTFFWCPSNSLHLQLHHLEPTHALKHFAKFSFQIANLFDMWHSMIINTSQLMRQCLISIH